MNRQTNKLQRTRRQGCASVAVLLLAAALGVAGCGGSSSGGSGIVVTPPPPPPPPPPPAAITMEIGQEYAVSAGSRLVSRSTSPARIKVSHLDDGSRAVVLVEGAADLHN